MATIEDFKKLQFIIAQIKEAEPHPNADKLYVIKVDTGTEVRQIVAGIRGSYSPEQLVGRRAVLVANLDPAVIRGVESQGMLLAASDASGISVLGPDRDVLLGSTVK
jgi:methionine--tRNA ligase beta chain